MRQALDEGIFGRWGTFKDFVDGEFRISEKQAYRLINAFNLSELLKRQHCPMPINERQIRPLYLLKRDRFRVLAWQRACKLKQGNLPTAADVSREVNKLLDRKPDPGTDSRYRAFRKALESARGQYARAHRLLDEGDLQVFLACKDKKSRSEKRQLLKMLEKFSEDLSRDSLHFYQEEAEESDE